MSSVERKEREATEEEMAEYNRATVAWSPPPHPDWCKCQRVCGGDQ